MASIRWYFGYLRGQLGGAGGSTAAQASSNLIVRICSNLPWLLGIDPFVRVLPTQESSSTAKVGGLGGYLEYLGFMGGFTTVGLHDFQYLS